MGEFFKPWRRRLGMVTLLMALTAAGAWARSQSVTDLISVETSKTTAFVLVSDRTGVLGIRLWQADGVLAYNKILLGSEDYPSAAGILNNVFTADSI